MLLNMRSALQRIERLSDRGLSVKRIKTRGKGLYIHKLIPRRVVLIYNVFVSIFHYKCATNLDVCRAMPA